MKMERNIKKYPMIIPTTLMDYQRVRRNFAVFFGNLPISRIIFIGANGLEECVRRDAEMQGFSDKIACIKEDDLIPFGAVQEAIRVRLAAEGFGISETSKPGWYYQQFLKMQFSSCCEEDYYLSWDADTIPLRKIDLFDPDGKSYIDVKAEYHAGYFNTIYHLFGIGKQVEKSFVSEHMLFRTAEIRQMIDEIESLPLNGKEFYEKIFSAIDLKDIKRGFSEFETFGTWVMFRYPEKHTIREWKSMRRGNLFTSPEELTAEDIAWLAESYDAISFETYHPYIRDLAELFRDKEYRRTIKAEELYLTVMKSGMFGTYEDGCIREGDILWPI